MQDLKYNSIFKLGLLKKKVVIKKRHISGRLNEPLLLTAGAARRAAQVIPFGSTYFLMGFTILISTVFLLQSYGFYVIL